MDKYFNSYREMISLCGLTDHTLKSYYKKTFLNFCIEDVRNPPRSFVLSMVLKNGMTSLVETPILWQMQSLTVLLMTVTVSTSQVLMQSMTSQCGKSMDWTKRYASKLA